MDEYHEPASVQITRLVCSAVLALTVLIGAGVMLLVYPEYANVAIGFIGVVVGASFGLVRRPVRRT